MTFQFRGKVYTLDTHGYLLPPEQWDKGFAEGMAIKVGILDGLGDRHWQIIDYLRRKFLDDNFVPLTVVACMDNKMRMGEFRALFPKGYHRGACRVAGINYAFMWEANPLLTYETTFPMGRNYEFDEIGFLTESSAWDEGFVAKMMLSLEGPDEPSEEHWRVIRFLREYYNENKTLPTVFETCSKNGLNFERLYELFPAGYRRGACRIAGLPFFS